MPPPDPIPRSPRPGGPPKRPPTPGEIQLQELLERGQERLRTFTGRLCRGGAAPCDPEDVAQEAMARAWRYRESLEPGQDGIPWLLRIAFRVYLDHTRPRPRPTPLGDLPEMPSGARDAVRDTDDRDAVAALLQPLKPIQRDVLLGFHRDGHSLQDLAARHRLPVNTIKSHLHRARRALREKGEQP